MLTVEEQFMMKDMHRRGVSISEIARRTGRDRKTVRKAVSTELGGGAKPRRTKRKKLSAYAGYLEQRVGEGVYNATKLYAEIKRLGYAGGRTLVKDFVQTRRPQRPPVATVRFETAPGEQGQVDWGYFGYIGHRQQQRRLYAFVLTLGWSRAMYLEFTVAANLAWFLRCHCHAFDYLGGVPRQIVHDNLKSAVVQRTGGVVQWNRTYLDFADYYGFTPHACRPYRPQTKGKVESGIKYVRGNFWPGLHFADLADLNQQAQAWLDQTANVRVHGTTGERPCDRLVQEQLLAHTGKPPYDTSLTFYRQSSRDLLISYEGNFYSVPAAFAQQRVLVKVDEHDELHIFSLCGEHLASHTLATGRHQRMVVHDHYRPLQSALHPHDRSHAGKHQPQVVHQPEQAPDLGSGFDACAVQPLAAASGAGVEVEVRPLTAYQSWLEEAL